MGFFDAALACGGPVFYKLLLIVNIVAVGIANIMNAQTASARLLYSMGRDGVIPRAFGKVHPKFQTPWFAAIAIGCVSLILPLFLDMATLSRFVNFGALSSFVLLNIAVFVFFFIKEKKRSSFGDIVKYLVLPSLGRAHPAVRVHRLRRADLHRGHRVARHRPHHRRREIEGLQGSPRGFQESRGVVLRRVIQA